MIESDALIQFHAKMGYYDNFALFSVALGKKITYDDEERLKEAATVAKGTPEHLLFGEGHRLNIGAFTECWWRRFDAFMFNFYEAYAGRGGKLTTFWLFLCEDDGDKLTRYTYVRGKRTADTNEILQKTDECFVVISCSLRTLWIRRNLTELYNEHYARPFEYGPELDQ